jgi:FkbM family methyltransferase
MLKRIIKKLVRLFKIYILKDKFLSAHSRWINDNGDNTLRLNYSLNSNSIVFDLGGYHGDFAEAIYSKYNSEIYIFEPVKEYYELIRKRFENNDKIHVYHFGLSDSDSSMEISVSESASSIYNDSEQKEKIYLKSVMNFITENKIEKINLFKINIEGGEFDVLPSILDANYMSNITDLQIQFHTFVDNAVEKRSKIRDSLSKTHTLTYNYWFIWENWTKNDKK